MTRPLLVVRADASGKLGAGHAMRCLTLVEAWLEMGGQAAIWGSIDLDFVRRRADAASVPIAKQPPEDTSLLLVDIYDEAERLSLAAGTQAKRIVVVDDFGRGVPTGYDAVWNPNAYGSADLYPAFEGAVIAGIDYVPIRSGLPRWAPVGDGAVSCGGGDVPRALRDALSHLPALLQIPRGWGVGSLTPPGWRRAQEDNVWADLQHAAWLITAAGSTVWEAAAVGIPVAVVVFAENQALVGDWAGNQGAPVVDVRNRTDSAAIAAELATKVREARPLPHLTSGADRVAHRLMQLLA